MKLFIGLDVSLAKTAVCIVSEHGKIVKEAEVGSDPAALTQFALEQQGEIAMIGMEAGPLSQWLHRGLSSGGEYSPIVGIENSLV
ncbi:MAG: IS110 family transposase, partial [Mesorhizobium sp.]